MRLTEEQENAISNISKNKIFIAGPGTGKSETIIAYIEYISDKLNINPKSIYLLTFTRSATADLKKKIYPKYPRDSEKPNIFTLHGFSLRQVVKNAKHVTSLPNHFSIADDYDERYTIYEDIKRYLNLKRIDDVRDLFNKLAANWETLNADRTGWELNFENPSFIGAWQEHREIYGYALRSELVYQLKNLLVFEDSPKLDGPIDILIIDEYQDLNRCDIFVIKELTKRGSRLLCAGDDDQSIYGFRYAYPEGIRRFKDDIVESEQFLFTKCFRCDKEILSFSLQVIRQDQNRIPKQLISNSEMSGKITILRFSNQNEEAARIADICAKLAEKGIRFKEILILVRSDKYGKFTKPIIDALLQCSIPVLFKKDTFSIFDTPTGRKFIAYLKLIENPKIDLALRAIIQETKGVGVKSIDNIYQAAKTEKKRFNEIIYEIINKKRNDIGLPNSVIDSLSSFLDPTKIQTLKDMDFDNLIQRIIGQIPDIKAEDYKEILLFFEKESLSNIPDLLSIIADIIGPEENENLDIDAVRVMTMHQAKGLSSDVVFVVAVEEEYLPGWNSNVEEERRLLDLLHK